MSTYRIIEYPYSAFSVFTMWFPEEHPLPLGEIEHSVLNLWDLNCEILQANVCIDLDAIIVAITVRGEDTFIVLDELPVYAVLLRSTLGQANNKDKSADINCFPGEIPVVIASPKNIMEQIRSKVSMWHQSETRIENVCAQDVTKREVSITMGYLPHVNLMIQCPPATRAGFLIIDFIYSYIAHRTGVLPRQICKGSNVQLAILPGSKKSLITICGWANESDAYTLYGSLKRFIEVSSNKSRIKAFPRAFRLAKLMQAKRREDIISDSQMQVRELGAVSGVVFVC